MQTIRVFVIMLLNAGVEERDWPGSRVAWVFGFPAMLLLGLLLAMIGVVIGLGLLLGTVQQLPLAATMLAWFVLWALYSSIVNVGGTFYSFGWETLLLEAGFLAVFLGNAATPPLWPVILFMLNALGFLYYWPTLLALFSRAAPPQVNATMMGMLFFSLFAGNVLVGTFGGWWELMSHARFFAFHAALALVPCVIMLAIARPFARLLAPPGVPSA